MKGQLESLENWKTLKILGLEGSQAVSMFSRNWNRNWNHVGIARSLESQIGRDIEVKRRTNEIRTAIVDCIQAFGGAGTSTAIAQKSGFPLSTVCYNLKRMVAAGKLEHKHQLYRLKRTP